MTHSVDTPLSNIPSTPRTKGGKGKDKLDVDAVFVDAPNPIPMISTTEETPMTHVESATTSKKQSSKKAKTTKKASAKPKKTKQPSKQGSKRERIIAMLNRQNGASLNEILKENPLNGKTPYATIAAIISTLGKEFKIERIGEGVAEHRRYRIK